MSTNPVRSFDPGVARVAMKFEVVVIPVSDVDRAKELYTKLGWRLDADFRFDNGFRVVQLMPPGAVNPPPPSEGQERQFTTHYERRLLVEVGHCPPAEDPVAVAQAIEDIARLASYVGRGA